MQTESIFDVKINNIHKVINSIRLDSKQKKDIAAESNLSFATVSNLCRELISNGVLKETPLETGNSNVGRLPKLISLNYNSFLGVCIDMHNKRHTVLAITNLRNEILIEKIISPKNYSNLEGFISDCYDACVLACNDIGVNKTKLIGVCVAVPAIYESKTGLTVSSSSGMNFLEGQPFKKMLEAKFNLPVFVDNEANISSRSIALNYADGGKNLIYIICSEGLGVGIITGGNQLVGSEGYASEVCHVPIGSERLVCHICGSRRCVESDLSVAGFITKYLNYDKYDEDELSSYWKRFLLAAEARDPAALAVIHENAEILGRLLSIIINLFDPETIYIGGEVAALFDIMKPILDQEVKSRLNVGKKLSPTWLVQDKDKNTITNGCAEMIYNKINFAAIKKPDRHS